MSENDENPIFEEDTVFKENLSHLIAVCLSAGSKIDKKISPFKIKKLEKEISQKDKKKIKIAKEAVLQTKEE
ncbi:MAG: hypothetical protein ACOCP8_05350 [archaeon]